MDGTFFMLKAVCGYFVPSFSLPGAKEEAITA